ncbi:MAG: flagellar biosynthesis regulator FlaF [Paracoccaceae bacterium]
MSATNLAHRAYAPNQRSVRTPRSIEFEVMARITHRLKRAIQERDQRAEIEAMHENRLLWNTLAADVASEDNLLSEEIRAQIFYLAEFTAQHTNKVLSREANAVALLEINAAILGGLKSEGTKE